ncbi:LysR family transcriptional regulator [Chromobacterium haemolyticum]|uniref:LysR family transcriptional regulator n=1 Tax=Chromobacterium TaxID=535 RepID=UPI0040560893
MDNTDESERFAALPLFVAVIECGSFAAAGRKLGLSKSAVSKRVSLLEARLGVRLLQRTTRRLHLTEAGAQYHAYARQALVLAREGEDAIARLQSQPRGLLRISVPMVFGRLHLSPLAPEFLAACPGVQLDMQMDDRMVDLVEGGFDLAIRIGHLPESSLIARRIAPCRSVICAAPAYLARHGRPETPAQLAGHNCLRYAYYRGGAAWTLQGPDGPVAVEPRGNYLVNNSEALRDALLAGAGIAQMPTFIVGADLAAGRLLPLLERYPLPLHAVYAVFPERKHVPAKVSAFLEFIDRRLGGEPPPWERAPTDFPAAAD